MGDVYAFHFADPSVMEKRSPRQRLPQPEQTVAAQLQQGAGMCSVLDTTGGQTLDAYDINSGASIEPTSTVGINLLNLQLVYDYEDTSVRQGILTTNYLHLYCDW